MVARRTIVSILSVLVLAGGALATAGAVRGAPAVRPDPKKTAGEWLGEIIEVPGVSGHEERVREAIRERLPDWAKAKATVDDHGNLIVDVGSGGPWLLFVAHMDETGFVVTGVEGDGEIRLERKGGFHPTLYEGEAVWVHTSKGPVAAVVPPRDDPDDAYTYESVSLYAGADSSEGVEALGIAVGDTVTVPKRYERLLGRRLMGRAMDDRVGSAAMLWAIHRIDPAKLKRRVTFTWATEEEVGLIGARGMAETLKPEFVFPVDTFVSSDSPRENRRFADARLGQGAVVRAIDRSNIAPYRHVMRLVELAKGRGIPLQYGMTGGGNDGSAFVPGGAVDIPIAWPLRNSHSAVEVIDERDLDALGRLVVAIAEEF